MITTGLRKLLHRTPRVQTLDCGFERPDRSVGGYKEIIERLNNYCGPLAGKRVLEAGVAPVPDFIAELDRTFPLKEAVGINLIIKEPKKYSSTLRVDHGDLRKIEFPDNYFDLIISSAVFEHVHNFGIALGEMHRILKPGGSLYSIFGPIWSGSYGHHLWYWDGPRNITYHTLTLPAYCHLLISQAELHLWLEGNGEVKAKEIAEYVFLSDDQNRLMFSDYERVVSASSFERVFLIGYECHPSFAPSVAADCLSLLNQKYPADRDKFLYDGITMLLRKHLV
jgi:SAM-dependent methyltransferase